MQSLAEYAHQAGETFNVAIRSAFQSSAVSKIETRSNWNEGQWQIPIFFRAMTERDVESGTLEKPGECAMQGIVFVQC
jgi:hypothetical protein